MLSDKIVSASLPTTNIDRAVEFYQGKLGLSVLSKDDNMVYFGAGGDSGLSLYLRGETKADHTVATWKVDDLEAEVSELKDKGIVFEEYDMEEIKTEDSIATMGDTKAAWFKDPDNNILGIFQI